MEQEFKTIGLLDMNILPYLERQIPKRNYDILLKEMEKCKIKEEDIVQMLLHENDNERLFTITIKGFDEDYYIRVKKGVANE